MRLKKAQGKDVTGKQEGQKPLGRRKTQQMINQLVYENPVVQAKWAKDPHVIRARKLYFESASGLIRELAAAGFEVKSVGELVRKRVNYKTVVPILINWLHRASYLPLAEDIVRALSVRFARSEAVPVLLRMFRDPPEVTNPMRPANAPESAREHLRWVIGLALGAHANPAIAEELLELAQDRTYGEARREIVRELPKVRDERVVEVLLGLLDDPTVASPAIEAIGKMRIGDAAARLESMTDHPDKNIWDQAKKALRRIKG